MSQSIPPASLRSAATMASPIGPIHVTGDGRYVTSIRIGGPGPMTASADPLLAEVLAQLAAWLAGGLTLFDLPLAPAASPRGPAHRAAIAAIPHGMTMRYGDVAKAIGSSPRAVGQACRRNPFPIVIPCHRVLSANETIDHYSAGEGVFTKRWLLNHERRML